MDLTLWRKGGSKQIVPLPADKANAAYKAHRAIMDHPWCDYYRVTLNDPLAGNRILRDTYLDDNIGIGVTG